MFYVNRVSNFAVETVHGIVVAAIITSQSDLKKISASVAYVFLMGFGFYLHPKRLESEEDYRKNSVKIIRSLEENDCSFQVIFATLFMKIIGENLEDLYRQIRKSLYQR